MVYQHSVLNGLNHEDSAFEKNVNILGGNKWRQKYMLTYSFLQKAPITAMWKMYPIADVSLMGENIIIFFKITFKVFILEDIYITES